MALRFLAHRDHAGPGPVGQGTVIGTPEVGTMRGPKIAPTETQYGGIEQVPNTTTILNEGGSWPQNPIMTIVPSAQQGAREFVFDTRMELQAQPAPGRILRQLAGRFNGYIAGMSGSPVGVSGYPFNGDWAFIPHQNVPRKPYGPSPYVRSFDNNAPISAVYAGNPRGGR